MQMTNVKPGITSISVTVRSPFYFKVILAICQIYNQSQPCSVIAILKLTLTGVECIVFNETVYDK